jgi:hypothetical protein
MAKRKTNRVAWGLAAILAAALVGAGLVGVWWAFRPPMTVEAADKLIRTYLAPGADKIVVARFLDAHRWHHSGCEVPDAARRNDPNLPEYQASAWMYGWTDEWTDWKGFLNDYSTYLEMTFAFDNHGKLLRYDIQLIRVA